MISAVCCHYGRTWLLAEAVQSFFLQDYDKPAELIIVNDNTEVTVEIDTSAAPPARTVRVINWHCRMDTLADKFDLGIGVADYPLCIMWDDDDLSLPHRLHATETAHNQHADHGYIAYDRHYYCDRLGPHEVARGIHGGDSFTRKCYWRNGGSTGDGHNDQNLLRRVKDSNDYHAITPTMPFYLYRWEGVAAHHSHCHALDDAMTLFDRRVKSDPRYRIGHRRINPAYQPHTKRLVDRASVLARQAGQHALRELTQ